MAVHLFDRGSPVFRSSAEWNGTWQDAQRYGDLAAWGLLFFLVLTFGVIVVCVMALRTRPAIRPEHVLIEEVLGNEDALAVSRPGESCAAQPWEKPADWWKLPNE